ncbi:MAG: hypothetical protein GY694_06100 [Gammaproteobacteria bacterium]|nr:hypothetical protein [Gammaproteobacteria bacterium]
MSKVKLILSNSPPLRVPVQFFFTAILFGIFAAILMLWKGSDAFIFRWSPAVLAVVHAMVLGYIGMIMQGALLQIVSVVLGKQPIYVERLSLFIHLFSSIGIFSLVWGFLSNNSHVLLFSAILIGLSFFIFLSSIIFSITGRKTRSDTGLGIAFSIISLLLTWLIGIWLIFGYTLDNVDLDRQLTTVHLAWGLLGWVSILVFTIAYEVVPMFQVTKNYPMILTRWLASLQFVGLLLISAHYIFAYSLLLNLGSLLMVICLGLFASTTLWLQYKRKKKQSDPTIWFWRIAMKFLLLALIFWLIAQFFPELSGKSNYSMILGILIIFGFILSTINGMLYKIIPFLVWLHLSTFVSQCKVSRRLIPNIKKMISVRMAYVQFGLHLLSILFMLFFQYFSILFTAAALSFLASNILLFWNLGLIIKLYKDSKNEIIKASCMVDS